MDPRQLMHLVYRLGSTSFSGLRQILRHLGGREGEAAAYIENLPPYLRWELQRWRRRQILAALRGEDPAKVPPPPTLRTALIEAIIESGRLPISDDELTLIMRGLEKGEGAKEAEER